MKHMARIRVGILVGFCFWPALPLAQSPGTSSDTPVAVVAELDGIIHPVSAEYLTGVIDQADTSAADIVIIVLRTPGGLLESTRTIVSRMITSRAPVAVLRRTLGRTRGVGGIRPDDGGRRRRHGARHAHRRGASGLGLRGNHGRDDLEEGRL